MEQLLFFPSRTLHDDGPDALAGAVSLAHGLPTGEAPRYIPVQQRMFQSRGAF